MVGVRKAGVVYDKILYRNERNQKKYDVRCIAESLPEKGPESEEARQMGLKLWDFDLKEKRMEITSDEQRVLRHALNDLRNQRLEEGKYTDGVEAAIMEVMKPHRTKHFPW